MNWRLTLTVGTEQMGVTNTDGIVNVEITLNSTVNKLQLTLVTVTLHNASD